MITNQNPVLKEIVDKYQEAIKGLFGYGLTGDLIPDIPTDDLTQVNTGANQSFKCNVLDNNGVRVFDLVFNTHKTSSDAILVSALFFLDLKDEDRHYAKITNQLVSLNNYTFAKFLNRLMDGTVYCKRKKEFDERPFRVLFYDLTNNDHISKFFKYKADINQIKEVTASGDTLILRKSTHFYGRSSFSAVDISVKKEKQLSDEFIQEILIRVMDIKEKQAKYCIFPKRSRFYDPIVLLWDLSEQENRKDFVLAIKTIIQQRRQFFQNFTDTVPLTSWDKAWMSLK